MRTIEHPLLESEPVPVSVTVTVSGELHPACWIVLPDRPCDIATMVIAGVVPVPVYFKLTVI